SDDLFRTLGALCETLVPALDGPAVNLAPLLTARVAGISNEEEQQRFRQGLTLLESRLMNLVLIGQFQCFTRMDQAGRERVLRAWATSRLGILRTGFQTWKRLTLFQYYTHRDESTGVNPHWSVLGYPGPVRAMAVAKPIVPLAVTNDTALDADVVVIGSGAGGGVAAGELATAGYQVIVLEKSGYANEADFDGAEMRSI